MQLISIDKLVQLISVEWHPSAAYVSLLFPLVVANAALLPGRKTGISIDLLLLTPHLSWLASFVGRYVQWLALSEDRCLLDEVSGKAHSNENRNTTVMMTVAAAVAQQ